MPTGVYPRTIRHRRAIAKGLARRKRKLGTEKPTENMLTEVLRKKVREMLQRVIREEIEAA